MAGVNRVTFIGNIGADPELKYTPSNKAVCSIRLAVNETWKDQNGQKHEHVEWVRVEAWGKTAENVAKYTSKGSQIYVEGRLRTDKWQDKEGNDRYTTKVIGDRIMFLSSKGSGSGSSGGRGGASELKENPGWDAEDGSGASGEVPPPHDDDDVPF